MKITHLYVKDFLGAALIDVPTPSPVVLFCGQNGAGKSSLRDAVALALTADLGRVSMKKDAPQLIRAGANSATCEVRTVDDDTYGVTITASGKMASTFNGAPFKGEHDAVMSYVLDSQRFARLDEKGRRSFLFGLLGVKMDAKSIAGRLAAMGCDAPKVERVAPLLRAGFAAAADDAREKATQAKGAWRAVTGETYGAVKAATWKATAPEWSADQLSSAQAELAAVEEAIGAAQQRVGSLEGGANRLTEMRQARAGLLGTAAELVRRQVKLQHDEVELKTWQDTLDTATAKAGAAPRVGLVHDLARSVNALLTLGLVDLDSVVGTDAANARDAYVDQHGGFNEAQGDNESRARLPQIVSTRDLMASAVRNSMRDVKAAEDAAAQIKMLDEQVAAAGDGGAAELEIARQQLAAAQAERKTAAAALEVGRAAKAAAEGAARKTDDAAKHHADVEGWDKIADALSPDGIPAKILAEALGPVNERLAQSAVDAQWAEVVITADMAINVGGRAYHLVSESEAYRADAMIAEAVAFISGARLLVLDRFDVLDLAGRGDLLAWLDVLADNGEIDTALIFGTLKAKPVDLADTIEAHEIVAGQCVELALQAA